MERDETGLHVVDSREAERIAHARTQSGWRVFRLPENIANKEQFFDGIRSTLPLDPPLHGNRSWEALSDSLWSGLDQLHEERIVIVWPDALRMKGSDLAEFSTATSVLSDLSTSLADAEVSAGGPKKVLVLQVATPSELPRPNVR